MQERPAIGRFRFSLRVLLILVPVAGLMLGVAIRWVQREPERSWSVNQLELAIRAAQPPISNRRKAEEWCKANRIDYQYFDDPTGALKAGNRTAAQLAGFGSQNKKSVVRGTITGKAANVGYYSNGAAQHGEIYIFFFIDSNGVCVGHWIYPFESAQ